MWFLNFLKILYTPCSFFNTYFNNHRIVQAGLIVGFSRASTLCSKAHCGQSNQYYNLSPTNALASTDILGDYEFLSNKETTEFDRILL